MVRNPVRRAGVLRTDVLRLWLERDYGKFAKALMEEAES
jgi:hypothetical protein